MTRRRPEYPADQRRHGNHVVTAVLLVTLIGLGVGFLLARNTRDRPAVSKAAVATTSEIDSASGNDASADRPAKAPTLVIPPDSGASTTSGARVGTRPAPPTTEPCGYAATPANVQSYVGTEEEDGVEFKKFRVEFTSCSPPSDYVLETVSSRGTRLDGTEDEGGCDEQEFLALPGVDDGKIQSCIISSDEIMETYQTLTMCFRIHSSDHTATWGRYCATWDHP